MKRFYAENKYLVYLWIICAIALLIFCGHYNNILLDIGREIYYPERILEGKVLYKDLFNIYGPFSYLFNALLYKIFSPNILTLYFIGALTSFGIVSGIYLIARKYLSEILSFSIGFFTIISGVCAPHLFNYTLPYSFGMLYGTIGLIYSILFLIKFKEENRTEYFYISAILGGLCVSNKYDFILYGLLLFIFALFTKNKKIILNFVTCFLFVPLICGLVLFIQKLGINDCISAFNGIKSIVNSKSLEYFYTNQGIFFNPKIFVIWFFNIIKTGMCFGLLIFGIKAFEKNKFLGTSILSFGSIILYLIVSPAVFVFLVPLTLICGICAIKQYKKKPSLLYLLLGMLFVSAKSFWALLTLNYGNYIAPLVICTFLALLFTLIDKKYEKAFAIGLIVISINSLIGFGFNRLYLNDKISSNKGVIYTNKELAIPTDSLIIELEQNKAASAIIYPEGLIVNFLANVKSDDYYNSLLPLYTESLGENKFIERIKITKPEYIITNNLSMKEYGSNLLFQDYGLDLKKFTDENYELMEEINEGLTYRIYKIRQTK